MSGLDELLNGTQLKAPDTFTNDVMKEIRLYESRKRANATTKAMPVGLSLIAASLVTLFINITPIMDFLIRDMEKADFSKVGSINYEQFSDSIEILTLKADYLLSKPISYITQTIVKEEPSDE